MRVGTLCLFTIILVIVVTLLCLYRYEIYKTYIFTLGEPELSLYKKTIGWVHRNVPVVGSLVGSPNPSKSNMNLPFGFSWQLLVVLFIVASTFCFVSIVMPYYFMKATKDPIKDDHMNEEEDLTYIQHLGDYKLVKMLDKGGMGVVYGAKNQNDDTLYALKVMRKSAFLTSADKKSQKQSIKYKVTNCDLELQIMSMFTGSPFVVQLIEAFQTEWHLVVVMPLYRAGSLWQQLVFNRTNGFNEHEISHFALQLIQALNCLHSSGIIHNDVKPDNILVQMDGSLQLTDFGNAQIGVSKGEPHEFDAGGTPGYMSPEVLFSIPATNVADFWSLGVTLYVLAHHSYPYPMCGVDTFNIGTNEEIEEKVEDYLQLVEYCDRNGVSDDFYDFLSALLEVSPEDRLGSPNSRYGPAEDHVFLSNLDNKEKFIPVELELFKNIDDTRLSTNVVVQEFERVRLKQNRHVPFPTKYFRMLHGRC